MVKKHSFDEFNNTDMLIKLLLKKKIISEEDIYDTKMDMALETIADENRPITQGEINGD